MSVDLVGKGWNFPITLGRDQTIQLTNEDNEIQQAIRIILGTMPGERVMRPEFGSRIHELVFEPLNEETRSRARRYVIAALERWEPRIILTKVEILTEPGNQLPSHLSFNWEKDEGCLLIVMYYQIKTTRDERSLVYPFYLIPGE